MNIEDVNEIIQSIEDAKKTFCGGYTGPDDEELYEAYVHGMDTIQNMYKAKKKRLFYCNEED